MQARRRDFLRQKWQQYGSTTLAVTAALGWGLFLLERQRSGSGSRRRHGQRRSASTSPAKQERRSSSTRVPSDMQAVEAAPLQPAAPQRAPAWPAPEPERGERQQALAQQLQELKADLLQAEAQAQGGPSDISLDQHEEELRSLAEELEALRAQLDYDKLAGALSARTTPLPSRGGSGPLATPAAAAAEVAAEVQAQAVACSPAGERATAAAAQQGGGTPVGSDAWTPSAMASFQQRLTPLALQPANAPAQQRQEQQGGSQSWSPKATVASLADLQRSSSATAGSSTRLAALRPPYSASAGCSPAKAGGSPAGSLGRILRQTPSARELSDHQLRRSMAALSETQAAVAAARQALEAAASAPSTARPSPRQAPRPDTSAADRPASAPLVAAKRPGLPRPPTPTGARSEAGGDFRIGAFRPGSGSVGSTPRGTPRSSRRWQQLPSPTGSEAPGSSRIPKPRGNRWSPASSAASTPTTSRIPRPASTEAW